MPKSAILMPNWLGDFLLALSVAEQKAVQERDAVTIIVPEHLGSLSSALTHLPTIIYKRNTVSDFFKSINAVRKGNFDILYVIPPSFSSGLFALLTGIKKRRGVDKNCRSLLLTDIIRKSSLSRKNHITKHYTLILETAFQQPEKWNGVKFDSNPEYKNSIVICPGAAYGPAKQWQGFDELIGQLKGHPVVILGDKKDVMAVAGFQHHSDSNVSNLAGNTNLLEAARIIAGASIVVSNDSGLMHLAGFLGRPVVGIFGSTTPDWTRPLGSKTKIAYVNFPCSPCFERTCKYGHYQCLRNISVPMVMDLIKECMRAGDEK